MTPAQKKLQELVQDGGMIEQLAHALSGMTMHNRRARKIVVFCSPKSGSSFVSNMLVGLIHNSRKSHFARSLDGEVLDHRLSVLSTIAHVAGDYHAVGQHHAIATDFTMSMISRFDLLPIVMVRSILDSLVSLRDGTVREYDEGRAPTHEATSCFMDYETPVFRERFLGVSFEQQMDMLIETRALWYFQYRLSWAAAAERKESRILLVSYEDLAADNAVCMKRICDYIGLDVPLEDLERRSAVTRDAYGMSKFNVGAAGRGRELLTDAQVARVRAIGLLLADEETVDGLL